MYAPTTLVPARDFWQYCFFLPLAACSRVLLLLLLSCHETCKCSFCFCLHEFLKNFILLCDGWIGRVGIWSMENYSKTTLACIAIGWEWIEYILYVADFEFHTCWHFELYAKVCVRRRFDLLNIGKFVYETPWKYDFVHNTFSKLILSSTHR